MAERFSPIKEKSLLKESVAAVLSLAALGLLANAAVGSGRRKEIKDRAGGVCEGCGAKVTAKEVIIGHMDHTPNSRYRAKSNLRTHCLSCETKWHLTHVGTAKDIGLTEQDNDGTAIARLLQLLRQDPEKFVQLITTEKSYFTPSLFLRFYLNEPELVDKVFTENNLVFPVDIQQAITEFFAHDPEGFMFYYFRKKAAFDHFFATKELTLPVDLISFILWLSLENLERYIQLYLGYGSKLESFFSEQGCVLPSAKDLLVELAGTDKKKFMEIKQLHPEISSILGPKLLENLLS